MRQITTTNEIRRPLQENSAIETNSAESTFSAGVEEMPVFGTTALTVLFTGPVPEVSSSCTRGQRAFWLSANPPQPLKSGSGR
jgi:hypothetical protein